jgi:hypothetical protein
VSSRLTVLALSPLHQVSTSLLLFAPKIGDVLGADRAARSWSSARSCALLA